MNEQFDNLPWHDANLKSLYIDRQSPGEHDIVRVVVEWPDTLEMSSIEFYDCYALNARMNFGIVVDESILQAICVTDSSELKDIREKWLKIDVNLNGLKCYRIITNSTNSIIEIFSMGFQVV